MKNYQKKHDRLKELEQRHAAAEEGGGKERRVKGR